jgi:exoribonuclease-2
VSDPAAVVLPGSVLDREARARAASLYLPEGTVPMLPEVATERFGLGLADVSPALSFGLDLAPDGSLAGFEIVPGRVRVTRLSYEEAEARIEEDGLLRALYEAALRWQARRRAAGAIMIELPEADVRVRQGEVLVRPVLPLRSRIIVEEAMVAAGEAVARFAIEHGIPMPFAAQDAPDEAPAGVLQPETLSEMFALRRSLKPRRYQTTPAPHSGLGLAAYVQATSPMRRYLDLVSHQQLRAYLSGGPLLQAEDILERIGEVEAAGGSLRQVERLADQHWIGVFLLAHPGWQGEGILVEKRGMSGTFLLPELALETRVHMSADLPLDSHATLVLTGVDLPRLDARFRIK